MRPPWLRRQEAEIRIKARELLDFVGLGAQAEMNAELLPYGQQRLLEVARAMAAQPRLLLLDEPAAGLNAHETDALAEVIQQINARGVTVLLIEHDVGLVTRIAHRIAVLDFGCKIAEGTPDEIKTASRRDRRVSWDGGRTCLAWLSSYKAWSTASASGWSMASSRSDSASFITPAAS